MADGAENVPGLSKVPKTRIGVIANNANLVQNNANNFYVFALFAVIRIISDYSGGRRAFPTAAKEYP